MAYKSKEAAYMDNIELPTYAHRFDVARLAEQGIRMVATEGGFAIWGEGSLSPELLQTMTSAMQEAGLEARDREDVFELLSELFLWAAVRRATKP